MSEFTSLNGYGVKDPIARNIAKGRNQAVAFSDYAMMIDALNAMDNTEYKTGQNIYIGTVGVPDLWVYSVEPILHTFEYSTDEDVVEKLTENTTVQIGYYRLAMLEGQKVDLTTYDKAIADLTASDGTQFRFGITEDGKYGYIVTDEEGADSVVPFSNPYLKFDAENGGVFAMDDTGNWTLIYETDTLPIISFDGILYEMGVYSERYGTDYKITSGTTNFNPLNANGICMYNSISEGTSSGLVCMTTPINCNGYTTLNVTVKTTSTTTNAPGSGSIGFGLTTGVTATSGLVKTSAIGTNTTKTHTFDVTDYDEVYLYMYNTQNSSITDVFTRNQWITKIEITK